MIGLLGWSNWATNSARDVLVRHGGMTLTDANRFVEELKRKT